MKKTPLIIINKKKKNQEPSPEKCFTINPFVDCSESRSVIYNNAFDSPCNLYPRPDRFVWPDLTFQWTSVHARPPRTLILLYAYVLTRIKRTFYPPKDRDVGEHIVPTALFDCRDNLLS